MAAEKGNKYAVGRFMYKDEKELQKKIDEYFEECKGYYLKKDNGDYMLDKFGKPIIANAKPPTITGLALYLGFSGRETLLNYQKREKFMDTITVAKSRVEQYAEERLFDKDGVTGAKFSLVNNFRKWKEKPDGEAVNPAISINLKGV